MLTTVAGGAPSHKASPDRTKKRDPWNQTRLRDYAICSLRTCHLSPAKQNLIQQRLFAESVS